MSREVNAPRYERPNQGRSLGRRFRVGSLSFIWPHGHTNSLMIAGAHWLDTPRASGVIDQD
jgi:hypothetical protein